MTHYQKLREDGWTPTLEFFWRDAYGSDEPVLQQKFVNSLGGEHWQDLERGLYPSEHN